MKIKCHDCDREVSVDGERASDYRCPKCEWVRWQNRGEPAKPYRLSENDRRFLRSVRIQPEA